MDARPRDDYTPGDVASSFEVSHSQSTQAIIATASTVTQCAVKFFRSTASQTEAKSSGTSESELDNPDVGCASSEGLHSSRDSAYNTSEASAQLQAEHVSRSREVTAFDCNTIQIGEEHFTSQACQQRKRQEAASITHPRPSSCSVCQKDFRQKDSLLAHLKEHSVTEADLVERLARRDSTAAPGGSRQRSSSAEMIEEVISSEDEGAAEVPVPKKRRKGRRGYSSGSSSDEEDAVELRRLLRKERKKTQQLRQKLEVTQQMHQRLQEQHSRMTDVLLSMLEKSSTSGHNSKASLHETAKPSGSSLPHPVANQHTRPADKMAVVRVAPRVSPAKTPSGAGHHREAGANMRQEPSPRAQNNVAGTSAEREQTGVQNDAEDPEPAGPSTALASPDPLEIIDDQVQLGDGISVSTAQWERLLSQKKDSLFVKELTKQLWGLPNLRGRSVTGHPCRRFPHRAMPKKRALSPIKLDAVGRAFDHYIARARREEPALTRRSKMKYFIGELLQDISKASHLR